MCPPSFTSTYLFGRPTVGAIVLSMGLTSWGYGRDVPCRSWRELHLILVETCRKPANHVGCYDVEDKWMDGMKAHSPANQEIQDSFNPDSLNEQQRKLYDVVTDHYANELSECRILGSCCSMLTV
jgi:hypothetical protein